MNAKFARKLLFVSLSTLAIAAGAQGATSGAYPATPGAYPMQPDATTTLVPPDATLPGDTTQPQNDRLPMTNEPTDVRVAPTPADAATVPIARPNGTDSSGYARDRSQIDPKCLKLAGTALDECLQGADRGQ